MKKEKIIGVIPARYGSTRFPGKPLAKILGKPMIQWVYEGAQKSKLLEEIYVATDDYRIMNVVKNFGGKAVMTSKHHKSGTDRIGEVVKKIKADIIVNIQGDEPLISAKDIDKTVKVLIDNKDINVSTLATQFCNIDELYNVNKVKVVFDKNHNALYFSRSIIPFQKLIFQNYSEGKTKWLSNKSVNRIFLKNYYLHIGLYVYRREFLLKFINMNQSRLEKLEKLEQLRILENEEKIKIIISKNSPVSIDTPEDIKMILKKLKDK